MKLLGISETNYNRQQELYYQIYALYSTSDKTLQQIGDTHGITRQRVSQIVLRCTVGGGDYYQGCVLARRAWETLKEDYKGKKLTQEFQKWLAMRGVKTAKNNKAFTLYLGKNSAKRK